MTEWLGDTFWDVNKNEIGPEGIEGYPLLMVVHVAKWWPGSNYFINNIIPKYNKWNKKDTGNPDDEEKNIQIILVSGDQTQ